MPGFGVSPPCGGRGSPTGRPLSFSGNLPAASAVPSRGCGAPPRIFAPALLLAAALVVPSFAHGDSASTLHSSPPSRPVVSIDLPGGIPLELVEATNGFFIGKYEVTQEQWFTLSKADLRTHYGKRLPIERISYGECLAFIDRANALDSVRAAGLRLRLPTEPEWEMCCRAGGEGTAFGLVANGEEGRLDDMGWYGANSGSAPHAVGLKAPNAWGVYDMHGNMWEMCATFAFGGYIGKGGGWVSRERACRASYRFAFLSFAIHADLGFRLAADSVAGRAAGTSAEAPFPPPQREGRAPARSQREPSREGRAPARPPRQGSGTAAPAPSLRSSPPPRPVVSIDLPGGIPLELVEATNGFFIGKYEVTQEQWQSLMQSVKSCFLGGRRPVDSLVWSDCRAFIDRANALDSVRAAGLRLRLPTEAEWEMCCRAGESDAAIGEALDERAWHWKTAEQATHEVGEKAPNAWGLHDMLGNVWELCSTAVYGLCLIKGGDWETSPSICTPSYRNPVWPHKVDSLNAFGFRLAADPIPIPNP